MRKFNAFEIVDGRVQYTKQIQDAVLNPRINGLKIVMNSGYDWIDQRYGFIKLLLNRGQVESITTHSDLLACDDYLEALRMGVFNRRASASILFVAKKLNRKNAYASAKRMEKAQAKYVAFVTRSNEQAA